jgi:hypothetical protein
MAESRRSQVSLTERGDHPRRALQVRNAEEDVEVLWEAARADVRLPVLPWLGREPRTKPCMDLARPNVSIAPEPSGRREFVERRSAPDPQLKKKGVPPRRRNPS